MDLDLLCAKKNCGKNRRAALQGLKRKKWYEKHLTYVDHAIETTRFACKNKEMIKVNDLIKGITLEADGTEDMSGKPYMSVNQEGEFKEDERLAELEGLKKSLNESLLEASRVEDRVHPSLALSSASPSSPGIMEEDEVENDLEYLRRWANESL
ncbi:charged multivesicular body protein 4c-like [Girardinichthys multiradiatus]|uniref:charged multivesicular body protein 4c-like n=1 Tax=Girardinichthys multiradiatus TaxID=208333 RepID=UPI001FABE4A2|nr:charged multivesicular body protein 4c-like [Girardinichthys multiradiatus]